MCRMVDLCTRDGRRCRSSDCHLPRIDCSPGPFPSSTTSPRQYDFRERVGSGVLRCRPARCGRSAARVEATFGFQRFCRTSSSTDSVRTTRQRARAHRSIGAMGWDADSSRAVRVQKMFGPVWRSPLAAFDARSGPVSSQRTSVGSMRVATFAFEAEQPEGPSPDRGVDWRVLHKVVRQLVQRAVSTRCRVLLATFCLGRAARCWALL